MFDIENNGLVQNLHLRFNAFFSELIRKGFDYRQSQLVVCGFPRSGTSLLYNMLSTSLPGFRYMNFEKYFIFNIHKLGNIASKAPMDILHIKDIDKLNINKKKLIILITVRDARDLITSRHPIYPDNYFIGYDKSWWPQNKDFTEWNYDAPGVIEVHDAIQKVKNRFDVLIIRYEDLVLNPDNIQKVIADKFKLKFTQYFSDYHKNPEKHAYQYAGKYAPNAPELVFENKSISSSRISRWKTSQGGIDRVKQQFTECPKLFSVLEAYGYEETRDWFDSI